MNRQWIPFQQAEKLKSHEMKEGSMKSDEGHKRQFLSTKFWGKF